MVACQMKCSDVKPGVAFVNEKYLDVVVSVTQDIDKTLIIMRLCVDHRTGWKCLNKVRMCESDLIYESDIWQELQ